MTFSVRIVKRFNAFPTWIRILIQSLTIALPFYFTAFLSFQVQQTAQLGNIQALVLHAAVIVAVTTTVVFITRLLQALQENVRLLEQNRAKALVQAYNLVDRYVTENTIMVHQSVVRFIDNDDEIGLVRALVGAESSIKSLVEKLYFVMEAGFGNDGDLENRIDFEVTFMTKSYLDDRITIPAWANKDNRAPRSLLSRPEQPRVYNGTITAQVYREARPHCHIIEDTTLSHYDYQELYPGQKSRIRSSIIYPVLSDTNELLGTLVVHCNRVRFFLEEDRAYWRDLLEIFSKRVALEKMKLDMLHSHLKGRSIELSHIPPF